MSDEGQGREMFDRPERPDAVFVANDHMAFFVMDVLRFELGLSVPDDVSVVGFDDVPPAAWPAYSLTTVRQRANRMVEDLEHLVQNAASIFSIFCAKLSIYSLVDITTNEGYRCISKAI